ncbi:MAG: response regulator transcription factor [Acidobacteria bacterium]|nr:MAG: response regulator transcription factor [Acidobacteriota bacterium]
MVAPSPIRTLIADDEPLARERVRSLIADQPGLSVVGEAHDGDQAVEQILAHQPDLVFLDVQMPKKTGFDVIQSVGADRMPAVVFVTAYDQYAIKAFDVHAVDYLMKPFDRERFEGAVDRARRHFDANDSGALKSQLLRLVQQLQPSSAPRQERLIVKTGGRLFFLRADEIDWIEAAGNYVRLHVGKDAHLLRETMNSIEARLDPKIFLRIHRSRIVNMERVKELHPWFNGDYAVILRDGTKLMLSRGYRDKLQERLM